MVNKVTLEDGRTFTYIPEQREETILPTGQRIFYCDWQKVRWYLGAHWEFTGRIKYENNPKWDDTHCFLEVIHIWEERCWRSFFKKAPKTTIEWLSFNKFEYDYATIETIVECN